MEFVENPNKKNVRPILFGAAGIILTQLVFYFLVREKIEGWWHNVGDSFAILSTAFTGFALIGLWYTYSQVQNQIALTKRQNWEGFFVAMLNSWSNLVANFPTVSKTETRANHQKTFDTKPFEKNSGVLTHITDERGGKQYFATLSEKLRQFFLLDYVHPSNSNTTVATPRNLTPKELMMGYIRSSWSRFFADNESTVGIYFRLLFNIFEHIDQSGFSDKERDLYAKMVRAHLSQHELVLLFYNIHQDYPEFYQLVKRYKVLKSFKREWLLDPSHETLLESLL